MLSWGEIMFVFFIALLLFGADKIPEFARTAGKMIGEFNRVKESLKDELDNVKGEFDINEEINDIETAPEVQKINAEIEDHTSEDERNL